MLKGFARDKTGAIAPVVAISLFALIAVGGIAFDYARMAAMDSELQNAADQAALAAATQLDGLGGARSRATGAASDLAANITRFANDGGSAAVTIGGVAFYSCSAATAACAATSDADAKFVRVTVAPREAFYALTPVVGALRSGDMDAAALAGLHVAICKVPPVMVCNPEEPLNNTDEDYPFNPATGTGLKLITGNASAPGNFGWLEAGLQSGASQLAASLGYDSPLGECQPATGVTTKTGMNDSVLNAFNTRFDVYANGNQSCPNQYGGTCSPSTNTRKDLVCKSGNGTRCNNDSWDISAKPYRPTSVAVLPADGSKDPDIMGYPRDLCHAVPSGTAGACGTEGSGVWDRDAYFRVNYGWTSQSAWMSGTGLPANATRFEVYNWELDHPSVTVGTQQRGIAVPQVLSANNTAFGRPATGRAGLEPDGLLDRRQITVAVINCIANNLKGKTENVQVPIWMNAFLVEPSITRKVGSQTFADSKDVYVEVIDVNPASAAGGSGQVIGKNVPYLVE